MYWLKTLPLGAGKIELQLDICMSPAALAAPGLEERRSQLVKLICDIHREDSTSAPRCSAPISSGVTQHRPAVASRAAALGVLPLPRARTRNHQPHFNSRIGRMTPDDNNPERTERHRRVGRPRCRRCAGGQGRQVRRDQLRRHARQAQEQDGAARPSDPSGPWIGDVHRGCARRRAPRRERRRSRAASRPEPSDRHAVQPRESPGSQAICGSAIPRSTPAAGRSSSA